MKTFISSKLHGLTVTQKGLYYHGSVGISRELLLLAKIEEYEQVHVINLNNGQRWITYAISEEEPGILSLNGGSARLGELGDSCLVIAYQTAEKFSLATVVFCEDNKMSNILYYE